MAAWGGDARYTRLVEQHSSSLFHLALLLTGNRHDAEDVLQDALISVAAKWSSVLSLAYVRKAVSNRALDLVRRRRETPTDEVPEVSFTDSGFFEHEEDESFFQRVRRLPEKQRATLILRYYADLDDRAIASILGCSTETVRSQAHRGLAKLRGEIPESDALVGKEGEE
jgi:RNA polymerase sigma-70 factor (sigma-E family)